MKKKDAPQDPSALDNFTTDLVYALDENGKYVPVKSRGWEVKAKALEVAWDEIDEKTKAAIEKVKNHEASPILFFMQLRIMDVGIVADYTGFWKWQVKRHLKPEVFKNMSQSKLKKYAEVFEVTIEELKNPMLLEKS